MENKLKVVVSFMFVFYSCLPEGHPPDESKDAQQGIDVANDSAAPADKFAEDNLQTDTFDSIRIDQQVEPAFDVHDVEDHQVAEDKATDEVTHHDEITPPQDTYSDTDTPVGEDTKPDTDQEVDSSNGIDTPSGVDTPPIDTVECPPGSIYDPEEGKCVSFCDANQYFEAKLGKCVDYPCCDLNGSWEVNVLDPDTMIFTVYSVDIAQTVSYIEGKLILLNPPETSNCFGSLEKKSFTFNCANSNYTLSLTSGTATEAEISGFYSKKMKSGETINGAMNMTKLE